VGGGGAKRVAESFVDAHKLKHGGGNTGFMDGIVRVLKPDKNLR